MTSENHSCILHLEDDPVDARIIAREIGRVLPSAEVLRVATEESFLRELLLRDVEMVLVDHAIPGMDTLKAIEIVRRHDPRIPTILLSGQVTPDEVTRALEQGATDYVLKSHLARLGFVLRRALREKRERRARRQAEEQLLQIQKLEAVGKLAGGLAHDFNNHLSVILGMSELLALSEHLSDNDRRYLTHIRGAGERAADLVRRILALSRKRNREPEHIDPVAALKDAVALLRPLVPAPTRLELDCPPIDGRVLLESGNLDQVVMNLVINASHAIDRRREDGCVTVRARELPREGGRDISILVEDNGVGMDHGTLARIFDPFFTTKPAGRGTGLGLSMVHSLVVAGSGEITVDSKLGRGTTFEVRFPLIGEEEIGTERLERGMEVLIGDEHLLIVDDEEALLELYRTAFESSGYLVSTAGSGDAALARVAESSRPPDLLLTDVRMPGMSGPELARRLRELQPKLPVIFVSGYTAELLDPEELDRPNTEFVGKPATPATLARKVQRLLGRRGRR